MEELAALNAAIGLAEVLIPKVAELMKSGQVTPTEQAAVRAKYDALKAKADGLFSGPEWAV